MAEFETGEVVVDLVSLKPVRVVRLREFMEEAPGNVLVQSPGSGREYWVHEDYLLHLSARDGDVACGFCADLDGGVCVDCAGYEHMAAGQTDEDRAYDAAARARSVENDPVNHPSHYTAYKGVEVIQLTEQMNFNRGNAVKYISRAGYKNPDTEIEDLEKARWYIDREIKRLKATDG